MKPLMPMKARIENSGAPRTASRTATRMTRVTAPLHGESLPPILPEAESQELKAESSFSEILGQHGGSLQRVGVGILGRQIAAMRFGEPFGRRGLAGHDPG